MTTKREITLKFKASHQRGDSRRSFGAWPTKASNAASARAFGNLTRSGPQKEYQRPSKAPVTLAKIEPRKQEKER